MNLKLLSFGFIFVFLISFTSAVGVSQPYWDDNPLEVSDGENVNVTFTLFNLVGDDDFTLRLIEVNDSANIVTLPSETDYFLEAGTFTTSTVSVDVPENAQLGDEYLVHLAFDTVNPDDGAIVIGLRFNVIFPVVVVFDSDSDNDGVVDEEDFCPLTPKEDVALSRGCSCHQILDFRPGEDSIENRNGCGKGNLLVFEKAIGWASEIEF